MLETVKMLEYQLDLFPAKFYWRNKVYRIDAVNECKTVTLQPGETSPVYHFWVRCEGNLLHLVHIISSNYWGLQHN